MIPLADITSPFFRLRSPSPCLLDLRGESLRIRATAKPIITSTPKITSARFTGRDYLRFSTRRARDLHNRIHRDARCAETPDARKSPAQSPIEKLLVTGLLSVINPLHHPHSKDHGI